MISKHTHIININSTIRQALEKLTALGEDLTLFIVDHQEVLSGVITDGDIRRGLIKGITLDEAVSNIMNINFKYIFENEISFELINQLKKSSVGAYGAFQLMPGVARAMGLTVNNSIDERKDFEKSAMGSARLIKRVCIPEAKKILVSHNIQFNENDLWFRLFVLHVYHAGAINVRAVVNKINPTAGSQDLIKAMWQTSAASFGNNSKNYTQLALASQIILNELVYQSGASIFDCLTSNSSTTKALLEN